MNKKIPNTSGSQVIVKIGLKISFWGKIFKFNITISEVNEYQWNLGQNEGIEFKLPINMLARH